MDPPHHSTTVSSNPDNLGQMPRMPRLAAPETYRGFCGSKRGPALSAYSLRDIAIRLRTAGYRQARTRAKLPRAAGACHPCPGTRHDVLQVRCSRGDAVPVGPRRCQCFTSNRGGARCSTRARDARCPSRSGERAASYLYKQPTPCEFLNMQCWSWRGRR